MQPDQGISWDRFYQHPNEHNFTTVPVALAGVDGLMIEGCFTTSWPTLATGGGPVTLSCIPTGYDRKNMDKQCQASISMSKSLSVALPTKLVISRNKPPKNGRRNSNHGHAASRALAKGERQSTLWLWSSRFKAQSTMTTSSTDRLGGKNYAAGIQLGDIRTTTREPVVFCCRKLTPII